MIRRIHVNKHVIGSNRKTGKREPIFRVKTYKQNVAAFEVEFTGNAKMVYRPEKPLSCGAVAWIETTDPVICDGVSV